MPLEKSDIKIDWELERKVFLFAADETPDGLYELPSELGRYELTLTERIFVVLELLNELLKEGLITIDEYPSREATKPSRSFELIESQEILNNFYNWFPGSTPSYSVGITELGTQQLALLTEQETEQLRTRLFGTKKYS